MNISLVIPAYNERENLRPLVSACCDALAPYAGEHEIVLVDDGSTDGSHELIAELADACELLRPLHHPAGANIGCHPSELEGLGAARGDVALFLPADLQIHPAVLPRFLEAAARADIVASHRVHRADPRWRRYLSAANNRIERLLLGIGVQDAHSSMLLTRRAIDAVVPQVRSSSALIPAELLLRAARLDLSIAEIEIEHGPRLSGEQTGASLHEIFTVQLDMLRLGWMIRRERDPEPALQTLS